MTRLEEAYADTLNIFGSDVPGTEDDVVRRTIDGEHALADPVFAKLLKSRQFAVAG
jgi:hypothetical protein